MGAVFMQNATTGAVANSSTVTFSNSDRSVIPAALAYNPTEKSNEKDNSLEIIRLSLHMSNNGQIKDETAIFFNTDVPKRSQYHV